MTLIPEDFDWNLLGGALEDLKFYELLDTLGGDNDDGDSSDEKSGGGVVLAPRCIHGVAGGQGVGGVPSGLSDVSVTVGCGGLEEEIRDTGDRDCDTSSCPQETQNVPQYCIVDSPSSVRRVREQRSRRRCARGDCCVYNVWYDPEYAHWYTPCYHVCGSSGEGITPCCTPVLSDRLFSQFHSIYGRDDGPTDHPVNFRQFASYNRWQRLKGKCNQSIETVGLAGKV